MKKSLIISEADNIAAALENERVVEFFVNRGELLLGDIYTATVENILPGIDAAFVNLGKDKMGFLHANDVPGQGSLKEKLVPKQKLLVQITKEPTGHKGPRVSTAISLPGRFLVLVPEERGVSISRRISEAKERARLKAVVNLMKPPGVGLIIRTEAKGQNESELFSDFEELWDRWQTIVSDGEASIGPTLIYRDQDLLYRVIRDAYSNDIAEIIVDSPEAQKRATDYMAGWAGRQTKVLQHVGEEPLLLSKNIDREIEAALSDRVELPSGGHLNIQPTEALTVIDVNSGRFTSSRTQAETVRRTNLEAAQEIPRQLRLRNIGGMVIVDFIDMDSRRDQQQVLEQFQRALEDDRAKPQIGQLSDLGLVELTRRRQGQSLRELFTSHCPTCTGLGVVPALELGSGDQKRVLNFKKEEETGGRGRRQRNLRQQTGALRAATASGGRIKPIMVEPEIAELELEDLPEEILEQLPDEILQPGVPEKDFGSRRLNMFDDEDESSESAAATQEEPYARDRERGGRGRDDRAGRDRDRGRERGDDRGRGRDDRDRGGRRDFVEARPASVYTGDALDVDDEEDFPETPVAAVIDDSVDDDEIDEVRSVSTPPSQFSTSLYAADDDDEDEDDEDEDEDEAVTDVMPMPESPFETEIDPVTGIYRLKAKQSSPEYPQSAPEPQSSQQIDDAQELEAPARQQYTQSTDDLEDSQPPELFQHSESVHTASTIDLDGHPHETPIAWEKPLTEGGESGSSESWWQNEQQQSQQLGIPLPNRGESDEEPQHVEHGTRSEQE
jgi:Rne/Rng family ribonuclease